MPHPLSDVAGAVRVRSDTMANLNTRNAILARGEVAHAYDMDVVAFGDGINTWQNLPKLGKLILPNTQTVAYTLVLTDIGKAVEINSASNLALTVPPNSTVAFPIGTVVEFYRMGTGTVTITPGSGVTFRHPYSSLSLRTQYSTGRARKRATDEWVITGDFI